LKKKDLGLLMQLQYMALLVVSLLYLLYTIFVLISCINAIIALAWLHGPPAHTLYNTRDACISILHGICCPLASILFKIALVAVLQ
jgi:hypothetical protein